MKVLQLCKLSLQCNFELEKITNLLINIYVGLSNLLTWCVLLHISVTNYRVGLSVANCTKVQCLVPRHIYLDLNIRFSINSTDSKIYVG